MADNIAITPGAGATVATDDVGGVQYQRVKNTFGGDGTATDVDATHPMPVQIGDATNQANVLGGDTGQNAQVIAGTRKEVTFSTTTAQAVAVTDVSNYRWVSVQVTSQGGSSTITFQGSNDNTNWVSVPLMTTTSTAGPVVNATTGSNTMLHGPLPYRYFRLNVTGIVSGTTAGAAQFFSLPMGFQGLSVDTEMPSAATLADGAANPSAPMVAADSMLYNGTTWDRVRAANSAAGTTGTGVPGYAPMYHDGTNYQRINPSGSGLPMSGSYAELSGSASANSTDLVASTDVRAYKCWSIQLSGTFVASVSVQCSNDGTTWYSLFGGQVNSVATTPTTTFTAAGMWNGMIQGRYMRVRTFAYTSGTVTATVELTSETGPVTGVYVNGVLSNQLASSVTGTTGSGLTGVAAMYFDGTNYQRVSPTAPLPIVHAANTATLANVASSASNVTLLATNTARKGVVIYNDSSATLYVKFGATASTTSFTYLVAANSHLDLSNVYTGQIDGIWASANGNARVTELA